MKIEKMPWLRWGDPARLVRTVIHLRAGQIFNRVTRRLFPPRIARGSAPGLRPPKSTWTNCEGRPASMLSPRRFQFVGQVAELQDAAGWNDPRLPKLWLYNLHYFDDLRAQESGARLSWHRDLIDRWIAENPPAAGNGWEPYPTSLRIVNWVAWALSGNDLSPAALDSLAIQARLLSSAPEFHLLGNHLLANAKALVFAGCYFSGGEAEAWLRFGLDLLDREWREQILADGGHFELSPMYHAILLEDVLDLVQLTRIFPEALSNRLHAWRQLAERMIAWLSDMTHPDGEIAFFNDAAFGIARTYAELSGYAARFGVARPPAGPLCRPAPSGYVRLQAGPLLAIYDAAEIGPSYLPGHGHADTLSLEVSLGGRRLVTNGGTSSYAHGAVRDEERSTAAHATVEIDGRSSSEVWAGFRVGRRAHPFDVSVSATGELRSASASHDGYRWLPGKPIHRREVVVAPTLLLVRDHVTGTGNHAVIGRFPLHPSIVSVARDLKGWRIELPENRLIRVEVEGASEQFLADGFYAPAFGQRVLRPVLAWKHSGPLPLVVETRFEL